MSEVGYEFGGPVKWRVMVGTDYEDIDDLDKALGKIKRKLVDGTKSLVSIRKITLKEVPIQDVG